MSTLRHRINDALRDYHAVEDPEPVVSDDTIDRILALVREAMLSEKAVDSAAASMWERNLQSNDPAWPELDKLDSSLKTMYRREAADAILAAFDAATGEDGDDA